jgi:type II secretory pathway component PulL
MAASLLIILVAPLLINNSLHSSIASYNENTMTIFQQLNPGFKRLVNPKAQIDDLTKGVPLQSPVSSQDLEALSYVEVLSDKSIRSININFEGGEIKANVENLSPLKLSLFKELANSQPINISDSGLTKGSDGWNGSLIIYHEND